MYHLQPPTPVTIDNKVAKRIVNGTAKNNIHSNRHDILLSQKHNESKSFPHILGGSKEKHGGL